MRGDFQVGEWRVLPELDEIRSGDERVHLKRKVLEVLVALARRPREVVTKEELFEEVWEGAFVTDQVLSQAIFELRKALGDDSQEPSYIQTVPRRGYRLVAPVAQIEDRRQAEGGGPPAGLPSAGAAAGGEPLRGDENRRTGRGRRLGDRRGQGAPQRPRARRLLWAGAGGGLLLLALGVIGLRLADREEPSPAAGRWSSPPRLAVLSLRHPQADDEEKFFADGMTEALITELAQVRGLEVIARSSVRRFEDSDQPISGIARQLGADAVVEGTVARSGGRVRVTAQLIDGATESHLWAEHYDRPLEDVLELQRELARSIAAQVGVAVAPDAAGGPPTGRVDPQAYLDFLRGVHLFEDWSDLPASRQSFERAIARDPGYAPAHAYLARSLVALGVVHARPSREVFPRAREAALRAIEIDPRLPEGHAVLGAVRMFYDWDFPAAREAMETSLELNPNGVVGHDFLAYLAMLEGAHDESLRHARRALELDPFSHYQNGRLILALKWARRYEEALAQAERTIELYPRSGAARTFSVDLLALTRDCDRGLRLCEEIPATHVAKMSCARVDAVCGRPERARDAARQLEAGMPMTYPRPVYLAGLQAQLGETEEAFRLLRQARRDRDPDVAILRVNPFLDPLRDDPRFQELLDGVGR